MIAPREINGLGDLSTTRQSKCLPGQSQTWIPRRKLVKRERRHAEAGLRAIEVGDDGIGEEFGVTWAEFDLLEDEFHDDREAMGHFLTEFSAVQVDDKIECPKAPWRSHGPTLQGSRPIVDRATRTNHQ